jgi:hypothetical protein
VPQQEQKKLVGVYILNWILIFGVAIFAMYAFKQLNLDRKPQISGTLENFSNSEVLSTSFNDLYLHRIPQDNHSYSNYEWLLFNKEKRLDDGETIVFTIARSPGSEGVESTDYELPIRSDFYNTKVHLRRVQDDLFLWGQEKPLLKRQVLVGTLTNQDEHREPFELLTTARAQTPQQSFSEYDFTVGLESPDVIIRRTTRADLANQDQTVVLPWIDRVLKDPKSSYRLRLGVIVALDNMANLPSQALLPSTIAAIQRALNYPDPTLRNEAYNLAKRYNLIPVTVYEHIDFSGKSQVFGPGTYRADLGQLGNLPNDSASSVSIGKGFRVRLCENEANGKGGGLCEEKYAGWYPLKWAAESVADKVSFIQVITLRKD